MYSGYTACVRGLLLVLARGCWLAIARHVSQNQTENEVCCYHARARWDGLSGLRNVCIGLRNIYMGISHVDIGMSHVCIGKRSVSHRLLLDCSKSSGIRICMIYVYVYIYMYIYVYICTHIDKYRYTCTNIYRRIYYMSTSRQNTFVDGPRR